MNKKFNYRIIILFIPVLLVTITVTGCDMQFMGMEGDPYDQLVTTVDLPERVEQGEPFELRMTAENRSSEEVIIPHSCHLSTKTYVYNEFNLLRGLGGGCATAQDHELKPGEKFTYTYDIRAEVYAGDGKYGPTPAGEYVLIIEPIRQEDFPVVEVSFEVFSN